MRRILLVLIASLVGGCSEAVDGHLPAGSSGQAAAAGALAVAVEAPLPAAGEAAPVPVAGLPSPGPDRSAHPSGDPAAEGRAAPGMNRPTHIRGIYLNAWVAGSTVRSTELIELARRTEVNTFVIDAKDASGYVSYATGVDLAREIGADGEVRIRDVRALLDRLDAEGIWSIARIVVFQDPILARARPDMSVQDSFGMPWVDGQGHVWVNPWDRRVWDYHVALAREAAELGFREIQWDYIRFPDRPASEMESAVFPGGEGLPRSSAVQGFLLKARDELSDLDVPVTADVFGVTASVRRDVGIGQLWEEVAGSVDAILPMIYPSHYWEGSFGMAEPNAHPYEVVYEALRHAVERTAGMDDGAARVIPWLQDFTLGPPAYGVPEVRAQILAAYDAGIHEWVLWNASSRYTEGALVPESGWPDGVEPEIRRGAPGQEADEAPIP